MTRKRIFTVLGLLMLACIIWAGLWSYGWVHRGPIAASGGLYFIRPVEIYVPQFSQSDSRWKDHPLGPTPQTLGAEGCAVASAAMTLAAHGVDVDPGRLNEFLIATPGGFTPEGWIYWEKAAEFDPLLKEKLLPHYEDTPSHFLVDRNLIDGNPVIARLRYPNGVTHFVVICGKDGFDYLIRDPGRGGGKGVYALKEFGSGIEAIRFYRKP